MMNRKSFEIYLLTASGAAVIPSRSAPVDI
jgi:hypothetical protein